MIRLSNRIHPETKNQAPQVHYVSIPSEPHIIEVPVFQTVEIPVDRVVEKLVHVESEKVDLNDINNQLAVHSDQLSRHGDSFIAVGEGMHLLSNELEMQRRALIAIKAQRDVDRKRRLQLIMRLKKQRDEQRKLHLKVKLAIGASLLLSILSLLIKL